MPQGRSINVHVRAEVSDAMRKLMEVDSVSSLLTQNLAGMAGTLQAVQNQIRLMGAAAMSAKTGVRSLAGSVSSSNTQMAASYDRLARSMHLAGLNMGMTGPSTGMMGANAYAQSVQANTLSQYNALMSRRTPMIPSMYGMAPTGMMGANAYAQSVQANTLSQYQAFQGRIAAAGANTYPNRMAAANRRLGAYGSMWNMFPGAPSGSSPGYAPRTGGPRGRGSYGGSVGIGTATFLGLGMAHLGGRTIGAGASAQREAILGSYAQQQNAGATGSILRQGSQIGRPFGIGTGGAVTGIRQIAQLGAGTEGSQALFTGAAAFNLANRDVSIEQGAESLYRLFKSTSRGENREAQIGQMTQQSLAYASALQKVGDATAAGAQGVFSMMANMQQLGQFTNFTAGQIIALSGALADMNEDQKEMFRTALTRLFQKEFMDPEVAGKFAKAMNMTLEGFTKMRRTEPMELLLQLVNSLQSLPQSQQNELATLLGLDNVRDLLTIGTLSAGKLSEIMGVVNAELATGGDYLARMAKDLRYSVSGSIDNLSASFNSLGTSISLGVNVPLQVMMESLAGVVDMVANSPILSSMLLYGGGMMAGKMAKRFYNVQRYGRIGADNLAMASSGKGSMLGGIANAGLLAGSFIRHPFRGLKGRATLGAKIATSGARRGFITTGMQRFGANVLGFFGGRAGGKMAGRMLMSRGGSMALAGTGIGLPLAALSMGESVFKGVGGYFNALGDRGGASGALAELFGVLFNGLGKLGELVNGVIDFIGRGFKLLFDNPFVRPVFDWIQRGLSNVNDSLNPTGISPGEGVVEGNTYNVNMVSETSFERFAQTAHMAAPRGISVAGV